jgi:hypothetical protein
MDPLSRKTNLSSRLGLRAEKLHFSDKVSQDPKPKELIPKELISGWDPRRSVIWLYSVRYENAHRVQTKQVCELQIAFI